MVNTAEADCWLLILWIYIYVLCVHVSAVLDSDEIYKERLYDISLCTNCVTLCVLYRIFAFICICLCTHQKPALFAVLRSTWYLVCVCVSQPLCIFIYFLFFLAKTSKQQQQQKKQKFVKAIKIQRRSIRFDRDDRSVLTKNVWHTKMRTIAVPCRCCCRFSFA